MRTLALHLYHLALAIASFILMAVTLPMIVLVYLILHHLAEAVEWAGIHWICFLGRGVDPGWMFEEARRERRKHIDSRS